MPQTIRRIDNFHDLIELAPIGALIHDRKKIRYMNHFLLNLLQYDDVNQVLNVPVLDLIHPDYREAVDERIQRISTLNEITETREIVMLGRGGKPVEVEASGFPIFFQGEPAVQVIIQDIGPRKEAERKLEHQSRELEHTISKIQGIVWRADAKTFKFDFVSDCAESVLGYPTSAWLENENFWVEHIHPEDRKWTVDFCVAQTHALLHHEFEYRMIAADGRTVWLRDSVSVTQENGEPKTLYGLMTDITLNKKLEQGLLESEARFRLMAENSRDIIGKITLDAKVTYISPSATRILGYTTAEIVARDAFALVHPEDVPVIQEYIASYAPGQEIRKIEYRCMTKRGEYIWLEAAIAALDTVSDGVPEFLITSREITERKGLELKLQRSHELLHKISMQIPGILFKLRRDTEGVFTMPYLSESARPLGEMNPEDVARNFDIVLSRMHPADKDSFMAKTKKSAETLDKFSVEYRIIFPGMGLRWRLAEAMPEREEDGSTVWYGHVSDITERKLMQLALFESEARARLITENSPIGIYMVDERGENVFANHWFTEKQGIEPGDYAGTGWVQTIHPEDLTIVGLAWNDFWQHDFPYDMEYRALGKNKEELIFHGLAKKLYQGGRLVGAVGIVEDVTEKRRFEKSIRNLSGKIIDLSEKERADFSRELHDSVGQNLVLLKLRLQSRMDALPEEQRGVLREFLEPIDNVLATSRDIARKLSPMHLKTLGLSLAIEDLCDQIRKLRPFEIELKLGDLDDIVSDEANIQIYRIVQEAVTNILKHSNARKFRIVLLEREGALTLTISDDGTGGADSPDDGRGIGLQIMRERARSIGGDFRFTKNQFGAEVAIDIPAKPI